MAGLLPCVLAALLILAASTARAQDNPVPGVYVHPGTEPIELIAWAERTPTGVLRMAAATLEDVPSVERVFRVLSNVPNWTPVGLWAATEAIFRTEFAERRQLPFAVLRLNIYAIGLRARDVETPESAGRLARRLRATEQNPAYVFVTLESRSGLVREYPIRLVPPVMP